MQKRLKEQSVILNQDGTLLDHGYNTTFDLIYEKDKVKRFRRKEWDFYQINNDEIILQLTISDIGYAINTGITLFSLDGKIRYSETKIKLFKKIDLESNGTIDHKISYQEKDFSIEFIKDKNTRYLKFNSNTKNKTKIKAQITLTEIDNADKMVIVTPFFKPKQFYLNYKENCFIAKGKVIVNDETYYFNEENSYGLIDFGRGRWPYKNEWFWANGSFKDKNSNILIGFNFGFGFGNTKDATENMYFINGKAYKLKNVTISYNKNNLMDDWEFHDEDDQVFLTMKPIYNNYTNTDFKIIKMTVHQVFGLFSGYFKDENNNKIFINKMLAFCEHCHNRY